MPLIHNLMVGKNQKTRIYNADALKIDEEISDCKKKTSDLHWTIIIIAEVNNQMKCDLFFSLFSTLNWRL